MVRELNGREFSRVRWAMKQAQEAMEAGEYKTALFELRAPLRLLERDSVQTRMLAVVLVLQADCYHDLRQKSKEKACLVHALDTLERIHDESPLGEQLKQRLADLEA